MISTGHNPSLNVAHILIGNHFSQKLSPQFMTETGFMHQEAPRCSSIRQRTFFFRTFVGNNKDPKPLDLVMKTGDSQNSSLLLTSSHLPLRIVATFLHQ